MSIPQNATDTPWTRLLLERNGAIATITLHRPEELHALDATMFDEIERAIQQLAGDDAIRVILITGSGERAFAAGADIRALTETDTVSGRAVSERGQHVFLGIERCGKPVIACVNGVALGGGCELALACTFRIASERAKLGLPELKLGLIPGYGGSQRLPRLRLGFVDEVVPAAELMPRTHTIAESIASMAPLAISGAMEAVARGEGKPTEEAMHVEAEIFGRLCGTSDKHEGLTAFLTKRPPKWTGA